MKSDIKQHTAQATSQETTIGGFEITKVIRQYVPIRAGGTASIGEILDMQLQEAAMAGEEVRDVKLNVNDDYWRNFVQEVRREVSESREPYMA